MAGLKLPSFSVLGKQWSKFGALSLRSMSVATQTQHAEKPKPKTGILMLNMGGPTKIEDVSDYLHRIMTDREIINLPMQSKLGPLIAKMRTSSVQKKYQEIGGGSPILKWTQSQGELLCKQLDQVSPETAPHKYYVGFRYAEPLTEDALQEIAEDGAEHTIIFSQYPQYSCATSGSSFTTIYKYFKNRELPKDMKWSIIDRWATHPLLIRTIAKKIQEELSQFPNSVRDDVLILFSAHSLPLKAVLTGDAYPSEVGATVAMVMQELNFCNPYTLVWQSKVGPIPWLAPLTHEAIKAYVNKGKKNFLLVPVAFVNEHIETLHEMDIEYCQELAESVGAEQIRRSAAPNDDPLFIDALTDIVITHLKSKRPVNPKFLTRCPFCTNPSCKDSKDWFQETCSI